MVNRTEMEMNRYKDGVLECEVVINLHKAAKKVAIRDSCLVISPLISQNHLFKERHK